MKNSIVDADIVMRNRVFEMNDGGLELPLTFDAFDFVDAFSGKGSLIHQNSTFLQFYLSFAASRRVGPTTYAPTRHYGDLYVSIFTKDAGDIKNAKLQEEVANWFAEQTIDGVRFRTFTPYPKSKEHGFTQYLGVIDFDFELYRGA